MCLEMALEIVSAHKVLFANVAFELTVSEVCLDVGLDVFLATKAAKAACK